MILYTLYKNSYIDISHLESTKGITCYVNSTNRCTCSCTFCLRQTKEMIEIIKSYQGEVVFHRAFDCVEDPYASIELLIELGVDRILTSGLKPKAMDGKDLIKDLQEKYGSQIEILAGSGMNASNAKEMMAYTGIYQVHSSCKDWVNDSTTHRHEVSYAYAPVPHENDYDVVSKELVEKIVKSI